MSRRSIRLFAFAVALATTGIVSCSDGGSSDVALTAVASDTGVAPKSDGFSFANFGSAVRPEMFDANDLVTMFGTSVCVDATASTCTPTAEAATWARMVNESRASGHCEGLVVQAANRFTAKEKPATVDLLNQGDVTHGIIRAFATQYLPEVQDTVREWSKRSLNEILNELSDSFKKGDVTYTMGLYTPTGGHAVLPYALQFPSKDLAVIKVYDSNWPGMERYVVIDIPAKTWYFSFSGQNPQDDPCAWVGKAGDIDITPMSARTSAKCPFCETKTEVSKTMLLIRSTSLDWKVKTKNGTFSPSQDAQVSGVTAHALRATTCGQTVRIPEFVLTSTESKFDLELPETSSVYVSNGVSVVHVETKGKRQRKPITFDNNTITVNDPTTTVTVTNDNLAAQVTTDLAQIDVLAEQIVVGVGSGDAQQQVVVNQQTPQLAVTTTNGQVTTTAPAPVVTSVVPVVVPELVPDPVAPGLPPIEQRNLKNAAYVETVASQPTTPVTAPPVTTTTTTTIKLTSTTLTSGDTSPTTTQAGSSSSVAPSTTVASSTTNGPTTTSPPSDRDIYLGWYPCPSLYVGGAYDGSTQQFSVNTQIEGRCGNGWLTYLNLTVTFDGHTANFGYAYQFRTCSTITYTASFPEYPNAPAVSGTYTPPQNRC